MSSSTVTPAADRSNGETSLEIRPIHAFSDNFIWSLRRRDSNKVVVVDPGDATPVLETLQESAQQLTAILVTHKHNDHIGGIERLLQHYPDIPVFGPAGEPIAPLSVRLQEGDKVALPGLDMHYRVLEVPGHTEGHIAYYNADGDGTLFCGDTLFSVGCGRVFSGSFEQLHDSLMRIAALPGSTHCYCAHEYTLDNIGFAKWVEPDNAALAAREQHCHALLAADDNTVPMRLADELACNPFLRLNSAEVLSAVERHAGRAMRDSRDTFRQLRTWKDREYD